MNRLIFILSLFLATMGGLQAQTMLGVGPTLTWRRGERMSYGYELSLKYYFGKKPTTKVTYYFEPISDTRDKLLADSIFAKQMMRFIDMRIDQKRQ